MPGAGGGNLSSAVSISQTRTTRRAGWAAAMRSKSASWVTTGSPCVIAVAAMKASVSRIVRCMPASRQAITSLAQSLITASLMGIGSDSRASDSVCALRARCSSSAAASTPSSNSPIVTTDIATLCGSGPRPRPDSSAIKIEVSSSPDVTGQPVSSQQDHQGLGAEQDRPNGPTSVPAATFRRANGCAHRGGRCQRPARPAPSTSPIHRHGVHRSPAWCDCAVPEHPPPCATA